MLLVYNEIEFYPEVLLQIEALGAIIVVIKAEN